MRGTVLLWAVIAANLVRASTIEVSQDHPDALYRVGETAAFTVSVRGDDGRLETAGVAQWRLDNFGSVKIGKGSVDLAKNNPFTVCGELKEAGFLRLEVDVSTNSLTWGVGYDVEDIRQDEPCPADFDAYWQAEKARLAREVRLDARCERSERLSAKDYDCYRVSFATFGGKRVNGFLTVPTDKTKAPFGVKVCVPGAGPGAPGPWHGSATEISLLLNVHGFEPSSDVSERTRQLNEQNAALAKKFALPNRNAYCALAGIAESREDYWFHDMMLGINRAVDWVCARKDVDLSRIGYYGSSQGGGFGLFLNYLNGHFTRAFVAVCAITGHYGYRQGRLDGWPRLISGQDPAKRSVAEKNAAYFDGVNFAARIRHPIRFLVGFADETCPPACVYAAYNACPSADKAIVNAIGSGHGWMNWYRRHRGVDCIDFDEWLRQIGIRVVAPETDGPVPLLTAEQRRFLSLSREERASYFDDARPDLEKTVSEIRSDPNPVVLRWEGTGRFKVVVRKAGGGKPVYEDTMRTNRAYIWNLEIGERYEWTVSDGVFEGRGSFRTADEAPRLIRIPGGKGLRGVPNFRDLGGRRTLSGRRIRQGMVYRSAGLNNNAETVYYKVAEIEALHRDGKLSGMGDVGREYAKKLDAGERLEQPYVRLVKKRPTEPGSPRLSEAWRLYLVEQLGLKTDIDLRSDLELCGMKTSPLGSDVKFVHDWENYHCYSAVHNLGRDATIRIFRLFQRPETYPVVFHCIGGADRTGTVAALLLGVLGVDEEEIRRDYQVTAWQGGVNDARHLGWFEAFVKSFDKFDGKTLSERICAYFMSIGFTEDDLAIIRECLLK